MNQTCTNGEWLEITISIHEQNWLFSDQTFQIFKMEVQKPCVFFKGVLLLKTLLNQTGSQRVHYQQNTHRFKKKILSGKFVFRCKLRELTTLNFWPCLQTERCSPYFFQQVCWSTGRNLRDDELMILTTKKTVIPVIPQVPSSVGFLKRGFQKTLQVRQVSSIQSSWLILLFEKIKVSKQSRVPCK